MPTGKPVPNMMNDEYFALLYTALKHANDIDYQAVTNDLGLPGVTFTKGRLQRVMKAQERTGRQAGQRAGEGKKSKAKAQDIDDADEPGKTTKKRKLNHAGDEPDQEHANVEKMADGIGKETKEEVQS